jgi:uncharacterized membrane protein YfcA
MLSVITLPMLAVFLAGTFAAAFVTGLAGFAFALVAAAIWLYVLPPAQATILIVSYGLIVQSFAVWKLRHALNSQRLMPLIAGSAVGVPLGLLLLRVAPTASLRAGIGAILILFSLYNLLRPALPAAKDAGRVADAGIGLVNGVLGGATGLAGIVVVIWSGLRGWPRDEQRAAFQPTAVATFLITLVALGGTGSITSEVVTLFALGLPALALGTWLGWQCFGKIDEAKFRKIVLVLLLASGAALMALALRG